MGREVHKLYCKRVPAPVIQARCWRFGCSASVGHTVVSPSSSGLAYIMESGAPGFVEDLYLLPLKSSSPDILAILIAIVLD